jgi:hypothetical protein
MTNTILESEKSDEESIGSDPVDGHLRADYDHGLRHSPVASNPGTRLFLCRHRSEPWITLDDN